MVRLLKELLTNATLLQDLVDTKCDCGLEFSKQSDFARLATVLLLVLFVSAYAPLFVQIRGIVIEH